MRSQHQESRLRDRQSDGIQEEWPRLAWEPGPPGLLWQSQLPDHLTRVSRALRVP